MAHGIFAPVPKRIKTSDKDVKKEVFDDEDELGAIDVRTAVCNHPHLNHTSIL